MQDSNPKNTKHQATEQDNFAAALRGEIPLSVGDILQRGWDITLRSLPIMLLGLVVLLLANWVISLVVAQIFPVDESNINMLHLSGQSIASSLLIAPFTAILYLIGLRNARDIKPSVNLFGEALAHAPKMVVIAAVLIVAMAIPTALLFLIFDASGTFFALFFLIAMYLQISFTLAVPLVLERNLPVMRAIMASVIILNKKMLPLLGLYVIMTIIIFISALPLLLGLLFTMPMWFNVIGVIYNRLIGVPSETNENSVATVEEES